LTISTRARVVVIGGGCVGASILHALTELGVSDCILLERTQLTAGSTWHAAGLLPTYSRRYSVGRMLLKSLEIYKSLDAATGHGIGLHLCGTLRVATTQERMDEFWSYVNVAASQGTPAHIVGPGDISKLWPLIDDPKRRILGGMYHPEDGHVAPSDVTHALANAARDKGARIQLHSEVTAIQRTRGGEWRVSTSCGDVICEHVVSATGNYARQTAAMVGIDLPAIPIVHQYWVTEEVPEVKVRRTRGEQELPILRHEGFAGYLREEGAGLLFGPYEDASRLELFAVDGVPTWFGADLLAEDLPSVEKQWTSATEIVPALGRAGIKRNVRGPFQMTADNLPLVGPSWGNPNFWLAEGVPGGILWGGAIGHYLADWIVEGDAGIDMSDVDPRRFGAYANKSWVCARVREVWGGHADIEYSGQEQVSARPSKTAPSYDQLSSRGAVWGSLNGWEVPLWFAAPGIEPIDRGSFRRANWFEPVGAEARAVRAAAGLIDMTAMTKFEVSGSGATAWLDELFANRLPKMGRVSLCHHLTPNGGVLSEYTVTRLAEDLYFLVSTPRAERLNLDILSRALPQDSTVQLRNVSEERGCLTVVGPMAHEILQPLVECDLVSDRFPRMTARTCSVGLAADVRLLRVNSEGELGWELYHPLSHHRYLTELVLKAGEAFGIRLVGFRAIESLRLEKSYRSIYRDMNTELTALESGLERFVAFDKESFVGRSALLVQRETGLARKLVTVRIEPGDSSVRGDENVYCRGALVGRITSGAYSYQFGCDLGLAVVPVELAAEGIRLEVPVLESMRHATVIPDSPYDPTSARMRA